MAYVTIDVDLNEVSDHELLMELKNRYLSDRQVLQIVSAAAGEDMLQLFLQNKDRLSLSEWEKLLNDQCLPPIVNPENQLKLAI